MAMANSSAFKIKCKCGYEGGPMEFNVRPASFIKNPKLRETLVDITCPKCKHSEMF